MDSRTIVMPSALLLDPGRSVSAKVVWLTSCLEGDAAAHPELPRLSYKTVRRAKGELAGRDWGGISGSSVTIPADLVTDRRVNHRAKLMYGVLQLTLVSGQFSYRQLSSLSGYTVNTAKAAIDSLVRHGWLDVQHPANRLHPVTFRLRNPVAQRQAAEVEAARLRIEEERPRGETIMREILDVLVDSTEFEDNAAPGFLVNPVTGKRLEFDRYDFTHRVAFEFQGAQHFGATERFTEAQSARQQVRDLTKLGLCARLGITLVEVLPGDLSLEGMRQKIGTLLPLRSLRGREALLELLDSAGRGYAAKARAGTRGRAQAKTQATTQAKTQDKIPSGSQGS